TMITSVMTNYSRNPLRRFEFKLTISADVELSMARQLGLEILQQMPGLLAEPAPQVLITDLRNNMVELDFMAWINQHESDFAKARSEAIRLVKCGFTKAGINMSNPIQRVQLADKNTERQNEKTLANTDQQ